MPDHPLPRVSIFVPTWQIVGAIDREVYLDAGAVRDRGVMKVTRTNDHRVFDGAQAARFLATLKALLENPVGVLI